MHRLVVLVSVLLLSACGQPGAASQVPAEPSTPLGASPPSSSAPSLPPSGEVADTVTLIEFGEAADVGAAAEQELELHHQVRDDAGMVALIGPDGAAVFTQLDAIEEEFAQALIADVAATLDAGELPHEGALGLEAMAAVGGFESTATGSALDAIDISLFANTGFTTSTLMSMFASVIERAGESRSGTLPRQEHIDRTENGIRQVVDLGTTINVTTGNGHVMMDIIMTATDSVSNAETGSFIALYTSRSTGHFDVNACPDEDGVGEGTYTFETKHELNDVSTAQAARSGAGRSADAPFRLINGDDAHLQRIEAALDLQADANGPGFDWGASQHADIVMPAGGGTTATGGGLSVSGTGGQNAGGAMFVSSAMAQLFLQQVGKEAEAFWRKGECITINTTKESKKVSAGESVQFDATAKGKFDGADIDAPIKGTFSGIESLDPDGEEQEPPASLTFEAGDEIGDKGIIELEQVGVRGIGKKKLEFEVGPTDYRWDHTAPGLGGMFGMKCDGREGHWVDHIEGSGNSGTIEFTLPEEGTTAPAHMVIDFGSGQGSIHWDLNGSVTFIEGEKPELAFGTFRGNSTIKIAGQTHTQPTEAIPFNLPLEVGDFCE